MKSLKGLEKLQKVRIDGHSLYEDWAAIWGAESVMRQVGLFYYSKYRGGPKEVFVNDDFINWGEGADSNRTKIHGHYDRVLEALSDIAEKDWSLEISLDSLHTCTVVNKQVDLTTCYFRGEAERVEFEVVV
jgi:hypothetical protein